MLPLHSLIFDIMMYRVAQKKHGSFRDFNTLCQCTDYRVQQKIAPGFLAQKWLRITFLFTTSAAWTTSKLW